MATISSFNVDPNTHAVTARKPVTKADAPAPTTTPSAPEPTDSNSCISFTAATKPTLRQPISSEMADMVDNIAKAEVKSEKLLVDAQGIRAQGSTGGNNPTNLIMLGDALEDHMAVASNVGSLKKADDQARVARFCSAMMAGSIGGVLGAVIGSCGFPLFNAPLGFPAGFPPTPGFDTFTRPMLGLDAFTAQSKNPAP